MAGVLRIALRLLGAVIALFLTALMLAPGPCFAEFPERPTNVLVPFPPGGAVDLVTRLVTQRITEARGWSFIIESKAAAGGVVATDTVARAAGGGYTLLIATPNHTIAAALKARPPYHSARGVGPGPVVAKVPGMLRGPPA